MNDDSSHTPLFSVYLSSKGKEKSLTERMHFMHISFVQNKTTMLGKTIQKKPQNYLVSPPPRGPAYPGSSDVIHVYKSLKFSLTILCNLHLK